MTRSVFVLALLLAAFSQASAAEVVLLYTGQTHAMIYPCRCPKEPDGGLSRRGSLVKELKKKYPQALLVDSGSFFAGGALDEYSQNAGLDLQRTLVNLEAMRMMGYDAAGIGPEEFAFGEDFFKANLKGPGMLFLSCDLKVENVAPYLIKEIAGLKVGVIAVSGPAAAAKAPGMVFGDPKEAVSQAVQALKKNGAGIIVLLSQMDREAEVELAAAVEGINVVISGGSRPREEVLVKIKDTLFLRPNWQGRRLSKAVLSVEGNKVSDCQVQEIRLSDKVPDDPKIIKVLPRCFSDANCLKQGSNGSCRQPGTIRSSCQFTEANKIALLVVTSRACKVCDTASMVDLLKKHFPGLTASYLYYPEAKAKKIVDELKLSGLPAYILDRRIEKEDKFAGLKNFMELRGGRYILKPEFAGLSYLPGRTKTKGGLDVFVSLFDKNTPGVLEAVRDLGASVHFLAVRQGEDFDAAGGRLEIEEDLRAYCVRRLYPDAFWDYLVCRSKNKDSSWWEDCAAGLDPGKIKDCARSGEARAELSQDALLDKELSLMLGPAYLMDNQQIFSTQGIPKKEDLKKIMR